MKVPQDTVIMLCMASHTLFDALSLRSGTVKGHFMMTLQRTLSTVIHKKLSHKVKKLQHMYGQSHIMIMMIDA